MYRAILRAHLLGEALPPAQRVRTAAREAALVGAAVDLGPRDLVARRIQRLPSWTSSAAAAPSCSGQLTMSGSQVIDARSGGCRALADAAPVAPLLCRRRNRAHPCRTRRRACGPVCSAHWQRRPRKNSDSNRRRLSRRGRSCSSSGESRPDLESRAALTPRSRSAGHLRSCCRRSRQVPTPTKAASRSTAHPRYRPQGRSPRNPCRCG